jgi:excisionase family DNA binding protein
MSVAVLEPVAPTEDERLQAQEAARRLAPRLTTQRPVQVQIVDEDRPPETVAIPLPALRLLARILAEMAEGNAVTLTPLHAEITTQEAADFLGVSRPFLVGLLEKGEIPFRMVGTHRRVRFRDVLGYKERIDAARAETLRELAAQAQELNMGY